MSIAAYSVGAYGLSKTDGDDRDPRGILWCWEEPRPSATYVCGVDVTTALDMPNWSRALRTKDDAKVDNSAIEVFRKGRGGPDVQVAEWAGPLDPENLAVVCNLVGRLYGESSPDGQALMCIEVYPGLGWHTQRELINRFGYTNLPPWIMESGGLMQKTTPHLGWRSNVNTRRDLWSRGATHINKGRVIFRSPALIEEMVDCTPDNFLAVTARALGGRHDDRMVATLIALWYLNEWSLDIEPSEPTILENPSLPDYQATAISAKAMMEEWSDKFSSLLGE